MALKSNEFNAVFDPQCRSVSKRLLLRFNETKALPWQYNFSNNKLSLKSRLEIGLISQLRILKEEKSSIPVRS